MPRELVITQWQWDEINLGKLAIHGLSRRIVLHVWGEAPRYRENKRRRAASHQMIGPDSGGAFWTICIVEVEGQPGLWRAITGWPSERHEIGWYERVRGIS